MADQVRSLDPPSLIIPSNDHQKTATIPPTLAIRRNALTTVLRLRNPIPASTS